MKLIITADDYGYSIKRDKAINQLYENNKITRTSLLVNGYGYMETQCPLGLHLNLSEGKSLGCYKYLTKDGYFLGKAGFHESQESIPCQEIMDEIKLQLKRFVELTGKEPEYIDGHQHVHVQEKVIEALMQCPVKNKYIRLPIQDIDGQERCPKDGSSVPINLFYQNIVKLAIKAKPILIKNNYRFTDHFFGLETMGTDMTLEKLNHALSKVMPGESIEWMVHPGFPSDTGGCGLGPDEFSKSHDRIHEYNFLMNLLLKDN